MPLSPALSPSGWIFQAGAGTSEPGSWYGCGVLIIPPPTWLAPSVTRRNFSSSFQLIFLYCKRQLRQNWWFVYEWTGIRTQPPALACWIPFSTHPVWTAMTQTSNLGKVQTKECMAASWFLQRHCLLCWWGSTCVGVGKACESWQKKRMRGWWKQLKMFILCFWGNLLA